MRLGPSGRRCDRGRTSSSWTREAALGGPGLPPEGGPLTRSCPGIRAAGAGRRCRGPAHGGCDCVQADDRRPATIALGERAILSLIADGIGRRSHNARDLAGHGTGARFYRHIGVTVACRTFCGRRRTSGARSGARRPGRARPLIAICGKSGTAICGKALPHGERYLRKTAAGEERPSILTGRPFVQPFSFEVSDRIRRRRSPSWFLAPPDRSVRRSLRALGLRLSWPWSWQ